jgi:uncharacterized protein
MMKDLKNNFLIKIREAVKSKEPKADLYLYGSRARGDYKDDSDWDILILSENQDFLKIEDQFRDAIYPLELESGQIISILTYSKEYWHTRMSITPLYKNIANEAIRL